MLFSRKDLEELSNQSYTYPSGMNGTLELGFDVETFEDVDKKFNEVVAKGARVITKPKTYPWQERSCYVADPDGNLIEIATWNTNKK